eukprot:jgi/Tetstr1/458162/TSEL_044653.t1
MDACVFVQKNLDLDKVMELLASYYGEAAVSAEAADLLKPCGEDWLAGQVLEGMAKVLGQGGLTNPGMWNPRNDEWDRCPTDEKKHARRDEYRHLMCYGVFTAAAHAALTDAVATLRAKNATARDTADATDLPNSAIPTIATCGQAAEDRLTYSGAAKAQAAAQFNGSGSGGSGGGSGGNIRIKEQKRAKHEDRATKDERADKNKDKDKITGKPQPGNPARKTPTPQTEEQN